MTTQEQLERARTELKTAEWYVKYHTDELESYQFKRDHWQSIVDHLEGVPTSDPPEVRDLRDQFRTESADCPAAPLEVEP